MLIVFQMCADVITFGMFVTGCVAFTVTRRLWCSCRTCLIGEEDSELLCLELLGGLDIPPAAAFTWV